jgi:hypothetical protein
MITAFDTAKRIISRESSPSREITSNQFMLICHDCAIQQRSHRAIIFYEVKSLLRISALSFV